MDKDDVTETAVAGGREPDGEPSSSSPPARRQPGTPVLPEVTTDEVDVGWGDAPARYDDDWYLSERPPHHD